MAISMKKRLTGLLLALLTMLSALPVAFAGYENFTPQAAYAAGQFADVPQGAWYEQNVRTAYEYGLINGKSADTFAPDGELTVAEAVKLAACIHRLYMQGDTDFAPADPWYRSYADYALANGLLAGEPESYDAPASRAVFAAVFAAALPEEALAPLGTVEDGAIPDVALSAAYAPAVYCLYRAGVLTGSDAQGSFLPDSRILRSEAAAIVTRMADPALRRPVELYVQLELTESEIISQCMPAVCKLYTYDAAGQSFGMGSAVVLSAEGDAVTCAHVINGVDRVVAKLPDGRSYEVSVYAMDTRLDLAAIRLEGAFDLPYLQTGGAVQRGDRVYTIGYPGGGAEKLSAGKVTNPAYTENALEPFIESSTVSLSGNSGGALVNRFGRVVGVVSKSPASGSPSYSMSIERIEALDRSRTYTPSEYTELHQPDAALCYADSYPVPDFGKLAGVSLLMREEEWKNGQHMVHYLYRVSDLPTNKRQAERLILEYIDLLNKHTFYLFSDEYYQSSAGYAYGVSLDAGRYEGQNVLFVSVVSNVQKGIGGLRVSPTPFLVFVQDALENNYKIIQNA